jgi:ATP-dependent RNA helicase DeaD
MNTFADFAISHDLLKGLSSLGFQEPTPVQAQVIPLMLGQQVDLVGLAQTGTGKTAAFGLPLIQLTDLKSKRTQGLVLCPTRELCVQVARDLADFARYVRGLKVLPVYGGSSIEQQIKALRKGVQIIVATPGRLNDLIRRGHVDISAVRYVVFDEADEMLQMGFRDELNAILAQTPAEKNTLLFSATMSREVAAIAAKYMSDPVELTIGKRNAGAENVTHEYYMVHARNRYLALKRIVDNCPGIYSIIFCRTRRETQEVADKLMQDGYNADALHGELSQVQRDQVMKKFRSRNLQLLVATDVAARGLDVNDLTHVINYNLPDDAGGYTHRSGRTGRAGRTGISIAIINIKEQYKIRQIEKRIKKKFKQCRIPSGEEICKNQLVSLIDGVTKVEVNHDQIDPLYAEISEKFAHLSREELIKQFVSLEFNRFLKYYENAPDLNVRNAANTRHGTREKQPGEFAGNANRRQRFTRFFLNVGRRQGIMPKELIGKINGISGVGRIKIGKIEIKRNTALLEADSRFIPQILGAFQQAEINGKIVSIKVAPRTNHTTGRSKRGGMSRRKGRRF